MDQQDGNQAAVADWRGHLTDELKSDPVVAGWAEKASEKDIPSILKGYAHAQKRMGSAINLPGENAKPEEIAALRQKLYGAKVFEAPPGKPEEYGLTDPGNLPEGLTFSPEIAGKFAAAMHKHGIPKSALADLMPVYMEAMQGHVTKLNADYEKIVSDLRNEYGEKFDERWEMGDRLAKAIFKNHSKEGLKFIKDSGFGALMLGPLLQLGHLAAQDSSYVPGGSNQGVSGTAAFEELSKIQNDKTHPMHLGYKSNDPKVMQHIQDLYDKAHGKEVVNV